jgi:hypothetical protein
MPPRRWRNHGARTQSALGILQFCDVRRGSHIIGTVFPSFAPSPPTEWRQTQRSAPTAGQQNDGSFDRGDMGAGAAKGREWSVVSGRQLNVGCWMLDRPLCRRARFWRHNSPVRGIGRGLAGVGVSCGRRLPTPTASTGWSCERDRGQRPSLQEFQCEAEDMYYSILTGAAKY